MLDGPYLTRSAAPTPRGHLEAIQHLHSRRVGPAGDREKIVLQVRGGFKRACHRGSSIKVSDYIWHQQTVYFATDPLGFDHISWNMTDEGKQMRMLRARHRPDAESTPDRTQSG
jgi:hypothetical protein